MTLVSRDPIARSELHKAIIEQSTYFNKSCDWCGSVCTRKNGTKYLFAFRLESDGGTVSPLKGLFCTESCFNSYYDRS